MAELLQQLLTDSARRSPRAVAVLADDMSLSYAELDRLSDRTARALQTRGIRRGDRVGILVGKSPAAIIAVFAALKAGACYVPLDPDSPEERLALITRDSDVAALLTDQAGAEHAAELARGDGSHSRDVLVIDPGAAEDDSAGSGESPAGTDATDADLAYILYTSGSTGVPKGVMISHRASLTFVRWAAACAQLGSEDRVCSPAPLHFDLSVFDIFAACSAGACITVAPARMTMFPARLAQWIAEHRVSVWYSVPSVLTMLATHGKLGTVDLSQLRMVIFAGEVFPAKHLSLLIEQLPDARHLNWYGPTETNVCTWYEVPRAGGPLTAPVPIGRACADLDVFAVSSDGRRVSQAGEEGELLVGGPGLMTGYWAAPEKTDEALVANPLADAGSQVVYRTGDVVTLDHDGNFVFLGRRDGMVKTRGYRVEVGEVETALYEHPAVREAAVLPVPDELLGNRLRALVSADAGAELSREQLLEHCRRRLPAYMVPDVIELRPTLPKTSTGKIDRVLLRSR
jgi:amino acid adenylation domain-containing protein